MNRNARLAMIAESICAAKGIQVNRKDKDLMDDTGGTSKGGYREPSQKPPRTDSQHVDRSKDKPAQDRDRDTDTDKDMKKAGIPSLDGFFSPLTYAERVRSCLVNILMDERHISEKAFTAVDAVVAEAKNTIQGKMDLVLECEAENARPALCAEILYGVIVASGKCENNLIKSSISRAGSIAALATGILSRFPQTLKALVQREG